MIPPRGFKSELYPLEHRLITSAGLSVVTENENTILMTLVRSTTDLETGVPGSIVVNPHHTGYVNDAGPAVCRMSIIDKMRISLRFNITEHVELDKITKVSFQWRPIFFSFREKLQAVDDDTGTSVETILGLTSEPINSDVVPLSTVKLPEAGDSNLLQPVSTVNIAEVFGDYNMTTNLINENHPWDEDLFQEALRRYSIKGALRSMVGSTRHVTLTPNKPYKNFYIDKFVPKAIRRVQPYTYFGIQVHCPVGSDHKGEYNATAVTGNVAHLGVKCLAQYHEWNADHYQEMSGTPP